MKWLIAFVLTAFIPTAGVVAQEVSALAPNSLSSIPTNSPGAQAQPAPQAICDDAVRGTWDLGLTYVVVKFRSSQFAATMSGVNSTFSYYVRNHFAIEGSVTSAFGSQSFDTADAKYMFYGGGVKLSAGNRKLQPFVHALIGGVHMFPQTAFSNNGFAMQLGVGAERRLVPRLWLRVGGDYVRSELYSTGQNNYQGEAGISYRF
jgi:hypothetical protein